jgi:L-ascorbate metabolism protein UlaG (beta-lactamase superfamily)
MRVSNINIIIDPVFNNASPFSFGIKPFDLEYPVKQEDFPEIDVVIITHNHYDHLDYKSY